MSKVISDFFRSFLKDTRGATAIEYGLIAVLISTSIIVGATAVSTSINQAFTTIAGDL